MEFFAFEDMPVDTSWPTGLKKLFVEDEEDLFPPERIRFADDIDVQDVIYSHKPEAELHMLIYSPKEKTKHHYPLVVCSPGSGWHKQTLTDNYTYAQHLVREGYIVASVQYRHAAIASMPAPIVDTKNAIKYLVLNAAKYSVDTQRIAVMGDSSGGHTALMVGLTPCQLFTDDEYKGIYFSIKCVIDFFGPTNFSTMRNAPYLAEDHAAADGSIGEVLGGRDVDECPEECELYSPVNYVKEGIQFPDVMILHGNRDGVIPFSQSVEMFEKLRDCGHYVEFLCFEKAAHWSGGFRSWTMLKAVRDFLKNNMRE